MMKPGNRGTCVDINPSRQDGYDRIRPQGGRGFRALQSLGIEYRRKSGKRDVGAGDLSERRGGASGANAFLESAANGCGKALQVRGLFGNTAQEFLNCFLSSYARKKARRPSLGACPLACGLFLLMLCSALLSGCGGHKPAQAQVPPPPPIPQEKEKPAATAPPAETTSEDEKIQVPAGAKPISEETGTASWYGAPYHNRRGSNGELYNMHAMTAAHRTLPLGSIVRVTNVKTGHSALVRITDRGPFVEGRVLDLSQAAAKKVDVWQAGVAMVRVEVLRAPSSLESGGRWAVQIGAFEKEHSADKFADHLSHRYQTAKVQCFSSPIGDWWVRVRVQDDDRKLAEEVARKTQTSQGAIFLVRLD